jgi:ABC-type phosphate transport system ATPase subunit
MRCLSGVKGARPQEAIRLLAGQGALEPEQIEELARVVKISAGIEGGTVPVWPHLTEAHLKTNAQLAPVTLFGSIGPLSNIDRLAADQPPLQFAKEGITLIYGNNGSGKSGYCRIAKKVCRCLHNVTLRGNVFEPQSATPRQITLRFKVEGEEKLRTVLWNDDDAPPPELARISVFDGDAAGIYVDDERRIEFLPSSLALLTNFATFLRDLEVRFKGEERTLYEVHKAVLPAGYNPGTAVSNIIATIAPGAGLPKEEDLRAVGNWTQSDEEELNQARQQISRDPALLIKLAQALKTSLDSELAEIRRLAATLDQPTIENLLNAKQKAVEARETAKAAAEALVMDSPLPQLGSEVWRQMLLRAREFAAEAFPELAPPQVATADVCVLCHQPLGEEARVRLASFDTYLTGKINEAAENAKLEFETLAKAILMLQISTTEELQKRWDQITANRESLAEAAKIYISLVDKLRSRHTVLSAAIKSADYFGLSDSSVVEQSQLDPLDQAVITLANEIAQLQLAVGQGTALQMLRARCKELEDRKKFASDLETFVSRRNSLALLAKIKTCTAACAGSTVTTFITKIRRKVLTPTLEAAFRDEIKEFRLQHLPLNLSDRGEVGKSKVQIGLDVKQKIQRNSEILSEGEKRALALAGFLAEAKELGSRHGVIIDDPVSSLDHTRMEAVAERLVKEAKSGRQVIIFTHNLFFHHALKGAAQSQKVKVREEWIAKHSDGRFGIIDDSQRPWASMKVKTRIAVIAELLQKKKTYSEADESVRPFVTEVYAKMRETWEQSIEEVLFSGVIGRFRPNVATMRLRSARIEQADYEAVYAGMSRCSKFSGHDQSAGVPPDLPLFSDLEKDLNELRTFFDAADKRRKDLEGEGKTYEDGPLIAEVLS